MNLIRIAGVLLFVFNVVLIILFPKIIWADPIRLSITPTISPLESKEQIEPSSANPQSKKISFRLNMEKKSNVEIDIYASDGKRVAVIKKVMSAGPGTLIWNCASVPSGDFQARVKVDGKEMKTRINLVK